MASPDTPIGRLLDARSRRVLRWVWTWASHQVTALKRRRKYLPRGAPLSPAEAQTLAALLALRRAAAALTATGDDVAEGKP